MTGNIKLLHPDGPMRRVPVSSKTNVARGPHLLRPRDAMEEARPEHLGRESDERFRVAIETMPDPFAIHTAIRDEAGRIVDFSIDYVNVATARFNGLSAEAHTGGRLLELFPSVRESGLFDAFVAVVETGESFAKESVVYEDPHAAGGPIASVLDIRAVRCGDGCIVSSRDLTDRARVERALQASEERYRSLVEGSADGILVSDASGRYVEVNPALCRMLGYARGELLAMRAGDLTAADDPVGNEVLDERLAEATDEAGLLVERRYRKRDGTSLPVEVRFRVLPDGRQQRNVRDISERVRAEAALRASEERYRSLVEQSSDAIFVVGADGRVLEANTAAAQLLGSAPVALPGRRWEELIAPDDLAANPLHFADLREGRTLRFERRLRRMDGAFVRVELSAKMLADGRFLEIARDIGERKRAEEALRRTTQLLEATQAVARIGGWELDVEHDALFWTAETYRIHETSPAEYSPTVATAIGFYAPESIPLITAAVQAAIERGTPYDLELELITATGRRIWVRATSSVTRDDQGRTTKLTGAFQDITEHKRLEAQLRQAQKMEAVGQLAGGIAHDFNNLLTAIRGYAELAGRGLDDDDRRRGDLEAVVANADRAAALTRQLLAFSRRQVLQPEVLEPAAIVEGIVPMLRRLLGEHVELTTHAASGPGRVKVDPSQLEQVLVNLAINARDAMPDGGKLTIETANVELGQDYVATHPEVSAGPHVLLAVSDTGHGMDAETQAHIFEPFFTTKEVGKGTGMGLATVYGIVKQSGGSIHLYSEPGRGTTFKIYLPRVVDEPTAAVAATRAARPAFAGTETILLVEDNAAVRGFARRALAEHGYTVLEAAGGAEALAIGAAHPGPVGLLVTDVVMPGLQGHQLAEQLAAARPELRVLYVSGFTENSVIHHGVPDHGVAFLPKPFSAEELCTAVRRVLDEQRR